MMMMMFKPFALVAAACALGLTSAGDPCNPPAPCPPNLYNACICGIGDDRRLDDSFLFPDGKHDAQRRTQDGDPCCDCKGQFERESVCCALANDRRLVGKSGKTKSPKSSKSCKSGKSGKSTGPPARRLSAEGSKFELPWATPAVDAAELLAADPGIWVVPGFLDEELVDKLKALVDKYGNDLGHYGECTAVHSDERKCFQFTPSLAETDKDDSELYLEVRAKAQSFWPQLRLRDYFTVVDQKGHAGPANYHNDGQLTPKQVTVLIYLTDSEEGTGGDTVFPLVGEDGLAVSPKKGTALTWLNVHADGVVNKNSLHGSQATTHESSGRTIITQKFFLSPEELSELTGKESSVYV